MTADPKRSLTFHDRQHSIWSASVTPSAKLLVALNEIGSDLDELAVVAGHVDVGKVHGWIRRGELAAVNVGDGTRPRHATSSSSFDTTGA